MESITKTSELMQISSLAMVCLIHRFTRKFLPKIEKNEVSNKLVRLRVCRLTRFALSLHPNELYLDYDLY